MFYAKKVENLTKEKINKKTQEENKTTVKYQLIIIILVILIWILSISVCIQGNLYSKLLLNLENSIENNYRKIKDNEEIQEDINENTVLNDEKKETNTQQQSETKVAKIIGKLSISDIDLKDKNIYEGTSLQVLSYGIGHFTNTSICNGNVGLASHNSGRTGG